MLNCSQLHQPSLDNSMLLSPQLRHASAKLHRGLNCAMRSWASQDAEDLLLLPVLLAAAELHGALDDFVEIGALDGVHLSNTIMIEKCFGWRGLLVEGQPQNFALLKQNVAAGFRPNSSIVHSAVCSPKGTIRFTMNSRKWISRNGTHNAVAGEESAMSDSFKKMWGWAHGTPVPVPCDSLGNVMSDAGRSRAASFLSLDVEGAEDKVIATVAPADFQLVMVELDGHDESKDARVRRTLWQGGLRPAPPAVRVMRSEVWMHPRLIATIEPDLGALEEYGDTVQDYVQCLSRHGRRRVRVSTRHSPPSSSPPPPPPAFRGFGSAQSANKIAPHVRMTHP